MSGQQIDEEKSKEKRSWRILRRNKSDQDEINELYIGDLYSKDHVIIGVNGAVAGNVSAPSIRINGTIFGSVTSPEIVIDQQGQVWGDVFATTMMVTVDAKVHGWISTFDVGTLELIQSGALSASDVMALQLSAQPEELAEMRRLAEKEGNIRHAGSQPLIHRKFQVEGGSAIIARLELEKFYGAAEANNGLDDSILSGPEDLKAALPGQGSVPPESRDAEIREKLKTVRDDLDSANTEISRLSADLQSSTEELEKLKTERDLFKGRFQKLARWVYQNQSDTIQ